MEMVSDEEWKIFCNKIETLENIYDLLVLMYLQIEGENKPQYIAQYYKNLNTLKDGYYGNLKLITNEMLKGYITFKYYINQLKKCIKKDNLHNIAVRIIKDFDIYIKERTKYPALALERESFTGQIYNMGPLNKVDETYGFYLMPENHYFKDFNKENIHIRFLEQSGFTAIDKSSEGPFYFKILKRDIINKRIKIKYYEKIQSLIKTYPEIKIGIIPVAKNLWCRPVYEEYNSKNYFSLEDDEARLDEINNKYINILQKCIREGIQIVVFPELAQNKNTIKKIQEFLIDETLNNKSNPLELIFIGSLWEDGKNEGILLSGAGTELIRSEKMNPFYLEKNGKLYWENLKKEANRIELLYIPVIGCIQYLICKDGLDSGWLHTIWGLFETAFSVISSYSSSISYFENIGSSFSTQYAGIQILGNACAPRIETGQSRKPEGTYKEIGHIIVPYRKDSTMAPSFKKEVYISMEHCKKCQFGECIHVFKLNPLIMNENNNFKDNYIETDHIIL